MKILGIDTSGTSLSAALSEDAELKSEVYIHNGLKHSQTLMPAVEQALADAETDVREIDLFAVSTGPGSFTGLRIGTAVCAAMAYAAGKPAVAVGTLECLIKNAPNDGRIVCAVMDARRGEVYTMAKRGDETVLGERAVPLTRLLSEQLPSGSVMFVGDAAVRFRDTILGMRPDSLFMPPQFMLQRASSVCMAACEKYQNKEILSFRELKPNYLRESQAERLRKECS